MKETQAVINTLKSRANDFLKLAHALQSFDVIVKRNKPRAKRKLSAAGRAAISRAQKARWAKKKKAAK